MSPDIAWYRLHWPDQKSDLQSHRV